VSEESTVDVPVDGGDEVSSGQESVVFESESEVGEPGPARAGGEVSRVGVVSIGLALKRVLSIGPEGRAVHHETPEPEGGVESPLADKSELSLLEVVDCFMSSEALITLTSAPDPESE